MIRLRTSALITLITAGSTLATGAHAAFAAQPLVVGQSAPAFTYHLLNGRQLTTSELRGHPYVLWLVASWCSSCETGSKVVSDHIGFLRSRNVRVVEMRLFEDLGAPGPGLQSFEKAVGANATSANWYWGELTEAQTAALDPQGYPDLYYLVDARGTIVAINGNPAASWDVIQRFATDSPKTAR
jgi:thiol-disulfide isomerase/thioredoxin